jgi:hypothetical protein
MSDDTLTMTTESVDRPKMPFGLWLATEGGRKCPQCHRYAKAAELGNLSFCYKTEYGGRGHVTMYGHLPGFGCNRGAKP